MRQAPAHEPIIPKPGNEKQLNAWPNYLSHSSAVASISQPGKEERKNWNYWAVKCSW